MSEPESLILQILREMRAELGEVRSDISQIRADFATKSDLSTFRADVAADMRTPRADVAPISCRPVRSLASRLWGSAAR
jgi:hypothetical protein